MNKILLTFLTVFAIVPAIGQNGPIDFEASGNGASWNWTTFENDTNPPLEIVDNPDATGANTSDKVAKFTALQSGEPFAGCETMHGAGVGTFSLNSNTSTITIMVWKSVISDVGIKLVDATSGSLGEIKVANTVVDEWEELSFDFSSAEGIVYDQIVIFPDFDIRTSDNVIYFDNITFGDQTPLDAPMVAAPDPTIDQANVISMFSGVYTDVPVDTWQTAWSNANLSDIQIAGNDTKKYASLDFVGIETTGANLIDASMMESFHVDVWTPNITTFRVKLVDFGADGMFDGGDDTEHEIIFDNYTQNSWVSHSIALSDFTGLTSKSNIAQLIFSCIPAGAGVAYIDNVYFSTIATSVTELEKSNIRLFPNPVSNSLHIQSDFNVENIKIYDVVGALVMDKQLIDGVTTLNTSQLANGIYLAKAFINGVTIVERFIKN